MDMIRFEWDENDPQGRRSKRCVSFEEADGIL